MPSRTHPDRQTTITEHEAGQVERANASGRTPVMFVHGLWLLPSSWDRWAELFEAAGYVALTPGWPDDPETAAQASEHPEVFAGKSIGQVADHFARDRRRAGPQAGHHRPLLRRPAGPRSSPAAAWPPCRWRSTRRRSAACCRCRSRRCRSASPALGNPANRHRAVPLTYDQFRYAFANAVTEDEAKQLYETFAVPAPGPAAVPGRGGQPQPVDRGEGRHRESRTAARCCSSPARRTTPSRGRSPTPPTSTRRTTRA